MAWVEVVECEMEDYDDDDDDDGIFGVHEWSLFVPLSLWC